MSYPIGRLLIIAGALTSTAGFILLPWILNQSGLKIAINYLSSPVRIESVLLWLVMVSIGGMYAAITLRPLRFASLILWIEAAMYYVFLTQSNGLFRAGGVNLLQIGFWCVMIGGAIHAVGVFLSKRLA